jgi:hypothetical protein
MRANTDVYKSTDGTGQPHLSESDDCHSRRSDSLVARSASASEQKSFSRAERRRSCVGDFKRGEGWQADVIS